MLYISKWKATAILLTACIVCLFAVPNFFPESMVKRWPEWAQRHIVLGLDLQGGSHILLEVDDGDVRAQKLRSVQDDVRRVLREARIQLVSPPQIRGNTVEVRIRVHGLRPPFRGDTPADRAVYYHRGGRRGCEPPMEPVATPGDG